MDEREVCPCCDAVGVCPDCDGDDPDCALCDGTGECPDCEGVGYLDEALGETK